MADTDQCYCGHVEDEHARNQAGHPAQCEAKDCPCVHYECDKDAPPGDVNG